MQYIQEPPADMIAADKTRLVIERAPSNRSTCISCKTTIRHGDIRLQAPTGAGNFKISYGSLCKKCGILGLKFLLNKITTEEQT